MTVPTDILAILTYTRNLQLFRELLYFLTAISMCMWCAVFVSTVARGVARRVYSSRRVVNNGGADSHTSE